MIVTPAPRPGAARLVDRDDGIGDRLVMERHDVESRLGELLEERLGGLDHEVAVQGTVGVGPQGSDHHRAEGDGRYEVPVHDVDMDDFGMLVDELDLIGQVREVGGQDRGGELPHEGHRTGRLRAS